MKALLINSSCEFGSTGRNVLEIADYMNSHGHVCYIAHTSGSNYKKEYVIGNFISNKLHALLSRIIGWQEIYSYFETILLCKFIIKNKFDIVNLNNIHSNYVSFPLLMKKMKQNGIPVVLTLHDCWFYTGKCTHYTKDNCFKWKQQCGNCPRLKKDITSYFFDFTKAMLKQKKSLYESSANLLGVIGVSDWITNESKQSILGVAKCTTRIYNWINLEVFRDLNKNDEFRDELNLDKDKKIILGVAINWTDDKGLSDFITLSKLLPENYLIVLVGENKTGLSLQNVRFVGVANGIEELVKYYNVADCYVSMSIEESFGKTIAEAMACGTPCVVYNSTATGELVSEGCGFSVGKNDVKAACEKIIEVCEKGKDKFSDKCRAFVKENFEKNNQVKKYLEFYKELDRMKC